MKKVAELLNDLTSEKVISSYALFGAVAQMRYTEAVATFDADVLVVLPEGESLDLLSPIYSFCKAHGYEPEGEAIRVGDWPVQFIPAFDSLTREATENAEIGVMDGVDLRVVGPDYLAVMALSVGRAKDKARILALLDSGVVSDLRVAELAAKHGLSSKWDEFREKFIET